MNRNNLNPVVIGTSLFLAGLGIGGGVVYLYCTRGQAKNKAYIEELEALLEAYKGDNETLEETFVSTSQDYKKLEQDFVETEARLHTMEKLAARVDGYGAGYIDPEEEIIEEPGMTITKLASEEYPTEDDPEIVRTVVLGNGVTLTDEHIIAYIDALGYSFEDHQDYVKGLKLTAMHNDSPTYYDDYIPNLLDKESNRLFVSNSSQETLGEISSMGYTFNTPEQEFKPSDGPQFITEEVFNKHIYGDGPKLWAMQDIFIFSECATMCEVDGQLIPDNFGIPDEVIEGELTNHFMTGYTEFAYLAVPNLALMFRAEIVEGTYLEDVDTFLEKRNGDSRIPHVHE